MNELVGSMPIFEPAIDNQSLTQKLIGYLRNMVLDGTLKPGVRLPNEPTLAEQFNVSRSTLRTALHGLEKEGFIIRRRGLGTFIAEKPLKVNNLNLNWGATEVIQSSGAVPGTIERLVVNRPASIRVAKRLNIEIGSSMVVIERVRTANDRRVIFMVDHIPCELLQNKSCNITLEEIDRYLDKYQSMYNFLDEYSVPKIHHAIAWLTPVTADKLLSDKLHTSMGSGLMYIEQVDYTIDERPLVLADEYHLADFFTFAVFRTR